MNRENPAARAADPIVIDVWVPHYPIMPQFQNWTQELAASFNVAHPQYRVTVHGYDYLTLPQEVHAAAGTGRAPAIVQYFYTSAQEARDTRRPDGRPLFTSVEKAIGGRAEILGEPVVLADLVPAARDYYRYDGAVAAMPPLASTTLLYANTTLLAAAGVPEVPQTWAALDAAAKALAALTDGPGHAITWPNHGWLFQQSVAQQGGLLADHDNGRSGRAETVDLGSDELLAYAEWWQRLHLDGHYLYTYDGVAVDWDANFAAFADQRVALVLTTSVEAPRMVAAGRAGGFDVVAARMPYNGAVPYAGNVIGGDSLWLADGLDEPTQDGALAFLQYLNSPRIAADRHQATNFIPVTRPAIGLLEQEGWFEANPHLRAAVDQLDATDGSPAARGALLGEFAGIQDAMTKAMHDVLATGADPLARFTQATAEAQRLLDGYNAYCAGRRPRGPIRVG
jgi:sn-glycerol 3-phosphate transport system substrate-binding protein